MPLTRIVETLLLPPGVIIIAIVVLGLLARRDRAPASRYGAFVVAAILYLLSIRPTGDLVLRALEDRYPPRTVESFAYRSGATGDGDRPTHIVVLGGGTVPGEPSESAGGGTSAHALKRLVFAARISNATELPIAISGGTPSPRVGLPSEAEIAAEILSELSIPSDRVVVEGSSRTTLENARYTAAIVGDGPVVLVTSAFHMPRSVRSFAHYEIETIPAPTDYQTTRGSFRVDDVLPTASQLATTTTGLREILGLIQYRLRGVKREDSR